MGAVPGRSQWGGVAGSGADGMAGLGSAWVDVAGVGVAGWGAGVGAMADAAGAGLVPVPSKLEPSPLKPRVAATWAWGSPADAWGTAAAGL